MIRQNKINKMLKGVECKRSLFKEYGKIVKITYGQLVAVVAAIPLCTGWLWAFVPYLNKKEAFRITLRC